MMIVALMMVNFWVQKNEGQLRLEGHHGSKFVDVFLWCIFLRMRVNQNAFEATCFLIIVPKRFGIIISLSDDNNLRLHLYPCDA